MSVDVWAETEQTLISRVHGTTQDATDKRRASVVLLQSVSHSGPRRSAVARSRRRARASVRTHPIGSLTPEPISRG
jgi:hypothetical protein